MICQSLVNQQSSPRKNAIFTAPKVTLAVFRSRILVSFSLVFLFAITSSTFAQSMDKDETPAGTRHFEVDNEHSSLVFAVSHAGLSYTYGRFDKCSGQVALNDNLDDTSFRFDIDAASINTNSRLRDDHLRGDEFFEVKKFPTISFRSSNVKLDEATGNYNVIGTMSMHGVDREVEMPITMIGVGKGPMGKTRGGFMTKFTLQRSEFGIDSLPKVIGDQIAITFSFEGIRREAPVEAMTGANSDKGN